MLLLFVFGKGNAQSTDSLLNQLARKWSNAKAYTLKMAALMPEEGYMFKPMSDEMTFGEQLLHMAQNMTSLSSAYLFGAKQNTKPDNKPVSKQGIINTLAAVL